MSDSDFYFGTGAGVLVTLGILAVAPSDGRDGVMVGLLLVGLIELVLAFRAAREGR